MITLIAIILIVSAMSDLAHADELERMERNAERRHREALKQQKNLSRTKQGKKTTRYIARDKDGRVIGKEVIEE